MKPYYRPEAVALLKREFQASARTVHRIMNPLCPKCITGECFTDEATTDEKVQISYIFPGHLLF